MSRPVRQNFLAIVFKPAAQAVEQSSKIRSEEVHMNQGHQHKFPHRLTKFPRKATRPSNFRDFR